MQRHWWLACPECLASCPAPTHLASSSSLTAHPSNLKRPLNSHCQGEETEAAPAPKLVQPLRSRPGVRCHHWKRPLNILSPTLTLASVSHHHRDLRTGTLLGHNRTMTSSLSWEQPGPHLVPSVLAILGAPQSHSGGTEQGGGFSLSQEPAQRLVLGGSRLTLGVFSIHPACFWHKSASCT